MKRFDWLLRRLSDGDLKCPFLDCPSGHLVKFLCPCPLPSSVLGHRSFGSSRVLKRPVLDGSSCRFCYRVNVAELQWHLPLMALMASSGRMCHSNLFTSRMSDNLSTANLQVCVSVTLQQSKWLYEHFPIKVCLRCNC